MAKTAKKDKLTIKERKFIKALSENGGNVYQAAKAAGYADSTAATDAYSLLDKPRVQTAFQALLEKQGITDELLSKTIREGLEAQKVISANVIAKDGEGMADANSMTKDFVEVPDHAVRHKFVDTVCKLKSHYPEEKVKMEHSGSVSFAVEVVDYSKSVRPKNGNGN